MVFVAAAQFLFPIRERGVNSAKRKQDAVAEAAAFGGEAGVDGAEIAVEERVETADPTLGNARLTELGHELTGFVAIKAAEGPAGEKEAGVDDGLTVRHS